ncbi:MAG: bifunctional diaminohydroxyphosphoribosylaminopyrimidine deaminase/5-amino-6-(5-phosphoribosylamino)uracil reductase RibD [Magnetococcales bacterium]|nr:bifunctional diaminohydroxyphosphoribosylaminopyrimidine deaminase/5-amino-6-(5-phosphoribosylamino)uracil reductase RibD [Magnetococcales bacterium]
MIRNDRHFMEQALRLARRAMGHTRPNPLVGCVIVREGQVVGKGYHLRAGEPHAEVLALRQAGASAQGATLYVTLEPCSHHGRTPPCADALVQAGVGRVVVAMIDPNPQVSGRGLQRLQKAGIEVTAGVCQEEAAALNQPFITWITLGRPLVTLKMAASLDGKTATHTGESQWITGPLARHHVQRMRAQHDLILVGIGTVLADNPRLNCRLPGGRDPIRLVVDSRLRTPPQAAILTASERAGIWIATTRHAPAERRIAFEKMGFHDEESGTAQRQLLLCRSTASGRVDLVDLLQQLGKRHILSLLAESGATLNAALLDAGLVDRLALFLAPRLIGGQGAAGLLHGDGVACLADAHRLTHLQITQVGEDFLLEGSLVNRCLPA